MKKDFYDKPLFTIPNYIFAFIQSSIYLMLCNIPLIFFFLITTKYTINNYMLPAYLCLIPLGPSLNALYYSISKMILEKDVFFSSYFWDFYKNNFISSLKIWMIELTVFAIFISDFEYFYFRMPERNIHLLFALLIVVTALISFYSLAISSKFTFKLKDNFILAAYFMLKFFHITILKAIIICFIYYLLNTSSIILLPLIPSIICFLFAYLDKNVLKEIEDKFVSHNK